MGHKHKKRSRSESNDERIDKKHKTSKRSHDSEEFKSSKRLKKKHKKEKKYRKSKKEQCKQSEEVNDNSGNQLADVPLELMTDSKAMLPLTKEEWEKKQNVIKRVFDEESGRYRLIKGDGEVIEEIVSRNRHQEINKTATKGDGTYFQTKILANIKNSK